MRTVPLLIVLFLSTLMNIGCSSLDRTGPGGYSHQEKNFLLYQDVKIRDPDDYLRGRGRTQGGYAQGYGRDFSNLPLCESFTKFSPYNGPCLPAPGAQPVMRNATLKNPNVASGADRGHW